MHVVIRLQNHGCRNHKYWWLVVSPKTKNIKGRFIEHVGYWVPREGKLVRRSIILNKQRIKHWLAMGAQVTPQVHRFLSYVDILPPPLIKHGSKTQYEKPKKIHSTSTYHPYNPIKSSFEKNFLDRIVEQENKNSIKREIFHSQEIFSELPPTSVEIQGQWEQLRSELYGLEKDSGKNPMRQEQVFRKMNLLAEEWQKEKHLDAIKVASDSSRGVEVTDSNVRKQMMIRDFIQEHDKQVKDKMEWMQDFQPLTEEEVYTYFETVNASVDEAKLDEIYLYAMESGQVVTKALIDDFMRHHFEDQDMIDDMNHLSAKDYSLTDIEYIPVAKPVHPLPDLNEYDAADYTDINKAREYLNKNKDFSIPNVHLEGDANEYYVNKKFNMVIRNGNRGRVTRERNQYHAAKKPKRK